MNILIFIYFNCINKKVPLSEIESLFSAPQADVLPLNHKSVGLYPFPDIIPHFCKLTQRAIRLIYKNIPMDGIGPS